MQYAVHTALWVDRWGEDLAPHLQRAADLGFDGAEVSLLGLDEAQASRLASVAGSLGIALRCTTGLGPDADPSSPDGATRAAGIDALRRGASIAAACGSDVLTGVTYGAWGAARSTDRDVLFRHAAESLAAAAPAFEDAGVTLGLEAVNRFESDLVNTAAQAVALAEASDSDHVGVHLDTFHMNIEERSLHDACVTAGDRLQHVHVVDNDRGAPGRGHVPWATLASGLAAVGYDGWIGLELFVRHDVDVSADLRIWREIEADADDAAAVGLAFVRELLG